MDNWKLLAAVPPLLLWCGLFVYLMTVDRRLRTVQNALERESDR